MSGAVLKCRRSELEKYHELFDQVGKVTRAESEALDPYMRFKYAAGRNFQRVRSVLQATVARWNEMLKPTQGWLAFQAARDEVCRKFCKQDEDGDPVITDGKDGEKLYDFTADGRQRANEAIDALTAGEYLVDFTLRQGKEREAREYLDEMVEVPIYTVPFATVPERVAGGFLAECAIMVDGLPDAEPTDEQGADPGVELRMHEVAPDGPDSTGRK